MGVTRSQIPIPVDTPNFVQRVALTGVIFTMHFVYNGRIDRFYLSLHDDKDNPIVTGMRVICDWPIMRKCRSTAMPVGFILFSDSSGNAEPPGLHELGRRVQLYYVEPDATT